VQDFVRLDSPEPILEFIAYGRSPRLHLNADAQGALREWFGGTAPLRVSIVRSKADPHLIAVGLDDYGVQLSEDGYASAARFTKRLGVQLPVSITLTPNDAMKLLIGKLPSQEIPTMPLQLPADPPDQSSLRGIIRAVSTTPLPDEEVAHEDTVYSDDEGDEEYEDDGAED
jgi:hypothetical protein